MNNWLYFPPSELDLWERYEQHTPQVSFRISKPEGGTEFRAEYRLPFMPAWTHLYLQARRNGEWDMDALKDASNVMDLIRRLYEEMCERETRLGRMGGGR